MNPTSFIEQFLEPLRRSGKKGRDLLRSVTQVVAGIPWGEGRTIEEVLSTKHVGTCTGKHIVLRACFEALSIESRIVVCTFRWSEQGLKLPENLSSLLKEDEWNHGHNFLQVKNSKGSWIDIDVTWDPPLASAGFRTFPEHWDGETSFVGLKSLVKRWDDASLDMKNEWIRALTPEMKERREKFLRGLFMWVENVRRG